jgi:hypothetical protein
VTSRWCGLIWWCGGDGSPVKVRSPESWRSKGGGKPCCCCCWVAAAAAGDGCCCCALFVGVAAADGSFGLRGAKCTSLVFSLMRSIMR